MPYDLRPMTCCDWVCFVKKPRTTEPTEITERLFAVTRFQINTSVFSVPSVVQIGFVSSFGFTAEVAEIAESDRIL